MEEVKHELIIFSENDALPRISVKEANQLMSSWVSNPYLQAATSDNTRKAYQADINHFEKWGGRLPASSEAISLYLQAFADILNPRTLARRLTAIKNWHLYQSFPDPTIHPTISKTLAGIMRIHGRPKEKAWPLAPNDLLTIARYLHLEDSLTAWRDNALLQIGFFGAFRRSELVAIHVEHLDWQKEGIDILIPKSKTDATNEGQYAAIPYGVEKLCPISALKQWLTVSNIKQGPIFRRIYSKGNLAPEGLTPLSVNHILKKRAKACKLPFADQLSSHSLRRGLATSASRSGAGLVAIMRQGRWKQVNTVMEYIDASERFKENAASSVMESITEK